MYVTIHINVVYVKHTSCVVALYTCAYNTNCVVFISGVVLIKVINVHYTCITKKRRYIRTLRYKCIKNMVHNVLYLHVIRYYFFMSL